MRILSDMFQDARRAEEYGSAAEKLLSLQGVTRSFTMCDTLAPVFSIVYELFVASRTHVYITTRFFSVSYALFRATPGVGGVPVPEILILTGENIGACAR